MTRITTRAVAALAMLGVCGGAFAVAYAQTAPKAHTMNEKTLMVGGAAMYPSKNIVENAVNSADHTTLVAAVMEREG